MSRIALLGVSIGVICVGAIVGAVANRDNVTSVERGITPGRVAALVSVLAIGGGLVGAGIAVVLLLGGR